VSLQNYITDTRNLIRDQQGLFVSTQTITGYINDARAATSLLTACCRRLVVGIPPFGASAQPGQAVPGGAMPGSDPNSTFQTIPNQERYPYIGFGNNYLNKQYRGLRGICDVISVSGSWGGAVRPSLDWMPFEEFQAFCRSNIILVTNYPIVFSIYNDGEAGEVWLFPVPQSANEMEWDTFCTAGPIYSNDDFDAIPPPFRNGVKYYAAARAFEDRGSYATAELNYQRFEMSNTLRRGAVDRGKVKTRYETYP
jgi:hypothetical protein